MSVIILQEQKAVQILYQPLMGWGGCLTAKDIDKAEMFNAFFAHIFNTDDRLRGVPEP